MAGKSSCSDESVELIDRISNLPDEIREYILGFLPICDAVRTSVLSKKWKYSWTKMVQLNLYYDEDIEFEMMENEDRTYFWMVGKVLSSHVGPIYKCVLHPVFCDLEGEMDTWLLWISKKGIKDLTFRYRFDTDIFALPPSIFRCLGLERLSLQFCDLRNSIAFKGFPNLVKLDLFGINVYGRMLEKVIANSPLEMLSIEAPNFYPIETDSYPRENAISAPNLKVLYIRCEDHGLQYSYLKYTPNLRVASFRMFSGGRVPDDMKSNCYYILRSMPKIEKLAFDCPLHKTSASDIIPKMLPEPLENLKTLTLGGMDTLSADQMSFMFCIIRNSPNLQNLTIKMRDTFDMDNPHDSSKAAIAYLEVEPKEELKTSIKTLSVILPVDIYVKHLAEKIAFLDSIVSCCPALEKLVIRGFCFLQDSDKMQLLNALRRYALSVSRLKIIIFAMAYY